MIKLRNSALIRVSPVIDPESKDASPSFSLIVAVADNGVIGREGKLPWRLKGDLRRFRALTMGHPLIMGRKTFQSIGKALDGRDSIVLSHAIPAEAAGAHWVADWGAAEVLARAFAAKRNVAEVFVIGGAALFDLALPFANRVYLSRVHAAPLGDVTWSPPGPPLWRQTSIAHRPRGDGDDFDVTDLVLERS